MNNICDNIAVHMNYTNFAEDDFFLAVFGYNDFRFFEPLKKFRVQSIYTLHYVLGGRGILEIGGKIYHLKANDMFFIPPNEIMRYYPDENNPWDYIWFEFSGNRINEYQSKMNFTIDNPVITCKNPNGVIDKIRENLAELNASKTIGYYTSLSLFYSILDTFNSQYEITTQNLREQIITYINCHYHDPELRIEDICRDFNISHSYLCKIFKKGNSAKQLLIDKRIEMARKLLLSTNLTVGEVGYSVGFKDCPHFMKTFSKCCGVTAGEYRKKERNH